MTKAWAARVANLFDHSVDRQCDRAKAVCRQHLTYRPAQLADAITHRTPRGTRGAARQHPAPRVAYLTPGPAQTHGAQIQLSLTLSAHARQYFY